MTNWRLIAQVSIGLASVCAVLSTSAQAETLALNSTKAEVEALVGKLSQDDNSALFNAYLADNQKMAALLPAQFAGKVPAFSNLYFDQDGRLWMYRIEFKGQPPAQANQDFEKFSAQFAQSYPVMARLSSKDTVASYSGYDAEADCDQIQNDGISKKLRADWNRFAAQAKSFDAPSMFSWMLTCGTSNFIDLHYQGDKSSTHTVTLESTPIDESGYELATLEQIVRGEPLQLTVAYYFSRLDGDAQSVWDMQDLYSE